MKKTKPFAELAARVKADSHRRERIEEHKRAINLALALAEWREKQTKNGAKGCVMMRKGARRTA